MPERNVSKFESTVAFARDYLRECGGSQSEFLYYLSEGFCIGQAFFNALSAQDQDRIRGKLQDPFYKYEPQCIYDAIEFLMAG